MTPGPAIYVDAQVLKFQLAWTAFLVLVAAVTHALIPDGNSIQSYYLLYAPISWAVAAAALLPITVLTRWIFSRAKLAHSTSARLKAFLISSSIWTSIALIAGTVTVVDEITFTRSIITLAISVPVFGLTVPIE